jgi:predicted RNA binding protein YcfA (HicA-like mRNA interferase family)
MKTPEFTAHEVITVLSENGFHLSRRQGSHAVLKYRHPTGETRTVVVPIRENLSTGTLRQIADASGADSFEKWCEWIRNNLEEVDEEI